MISELLLSNEFRAFFFNILKDDLSLDNTFYYELEARKKLRELIYKYKIGFDILSAPTQYIKERDDYFYKIDILQKGIVWI